MPKDDTEASFSYERKSNNELIITRYRGKNANITIPETIKGIPVTEIGRIGYNDFIETIVISTTIKKIHESAFTGCQNIRRIIVNNNESNISYQEINNYLRSNRLGRNVLGINIDEYAFNGLYGKIITLELSPPLQATRNILTIGNILHTFSERVLINYFTYEINRDSQNKRPSSTNINTSYYLYYNNEIVNIAYNYSSKLEVINSTRNKVLYKVTSNSKEQICLNNVPISDLHEYINIVSYNFDSDEKILFGRDGKNYTIYINNDKIVFNNCDQIRVLANGSVYYKSNRSIYKWLNNNASIIKEDNDDVYSSHFYINDDGSLFIYYCINKTNDDTISINDNIIFKPKYGISGINFSPNGKNFYYLEFPSQGQFIIRYLINGQIIPERLSGIYNGITVIGFSRDSNYCAFIVRLRDGSNVIVLNNRIIGPHWAITEGHFSDDSKYLIYKYANEDARIREARIEL